MSPAVNNTNCLPRNLGSRRFQQVFQTSISPAQIYCPLPWLLRELWSNSSYINVLHRKHFKLCSHAQGRRWVWLIYCIFREQHLASILWNMSGEKKGSMTLSSQRRTALVVNFHLVREEQVCFTECQLQKVGQNRNADHSEHWAHTHTPTHSDLIVA